MCVAGGSGECGCWRGGGGVGWVWACLCNFPVGTDCSEGFPILFMIRDAGSSDSICGDSGSF